MPTYTPSRVYFSSPFWMLLVNFTSLNLKSLLESFGVRSFRPPLFRKGGVGRYNSQASFTFFLIAFYEIHSFTTSERAVFGMVKSPQPHPIKHPQQGIFGWVSCSKTVIRCLENMFNIMAALPFGKLT